MVADLASAGSFLLESFLLALGTADLSAAGLFARSCVDLLHFETCSNEMLCEKRSACEENSLPH